MFPISSGPLSGVKILEIESIGPVPFCGMLLADLGAEIIRIDRATSSAYLLPLDPKFDIVSRGRRSIAVDIKSPEGIAIVKKTDVSV